MADPKTLILRFADLDDPTIDLHQAVLNRDGHVWWGWWKKMHEGQRLDVLEAVRSHLPETVGLVNRRTQQFYRARCDAMEFAGEGETMFSPDPGVTPDYYAESEYPAWFRFQEIKEIELDEWNDLFNDYGEPTGDDTLYPVEDVPTEPEPSSEIPRYEAGAPGELILHLSDLHYGDDHGFELNGKLEPPSMRRIIADAVEDVEGRVGVLIVSGDITTQHDVHIMQTKALEEIKGLAGDLGLSLDNVIVIPGNHDIKLLDAEFGSYKHERGFRTFLDMLFGGDIRMPDALFTYETPEGRTINVATLNSVRLSSNKTRQFGYVGPRSKFVFDALSERNRGRSTKELAGDGILNLTVLHHHLISGTLLTDPPPAAPVSLTLDAGRIVAEATDAGVHVALHGHEHLPFIGAAARQEPLEQDDWDGYKRPLMVIGGGSAGANHKRLPARMRDNTFGLYRPVDGGLEVSVYRFNYEVKPHRMVHTVLDFD